MRNSEIGAQTLEKEEKMETLTGPVDVYLKVFFNILKSNSEEAIINKVANHLSLRDIEGDNSMVIDVTGKYSSMILIDCTDLLINDDGICDDAEGEFLKILELIGKLQDIIDRLQGRVEDINIHVAIYGFELIEDVVRAAAYVIDGDNSLNICNEKLISYILKLEHPFDYLQSQHWFIWTDYVGVYEYNVLVQPLAGSIEKTDSLAETTKSINGQITKTTNNRDAFVDIDRDVESVTISEYDEDSNLIADYKLRIVKNEYRSSEDSSCDSRNWLDNTHAFLTILGFVPAMGEISSLIDGYLYLGQEINALKEGDYDKAIQYRNSAVHSFLFAIPGSSIIKGTIKIAKVTRSARNVQCIEKNLANAKRNSDIAKKSLNKIKKKKTTRGKVADAKKANVDASLQKKQIENELASAIELRNQRLEEAGLCVGDLINDGTHVIKQGYHQNMQYLSNTIMNKGVTTTEDRLIDGVWFFLQQVTDPYPAEVY